MLKTKLSFLTIALVNFGFSQSLPIGEVIDTVYTKTKGQVYALYLPADYDPTFEYPAIFFFDPSGNASYPIEKYKELANKYSVILACSHNSKNYTSTYLSLDAAQAMINDVQERLSIDKDLIITSGFSGGSRVALSVATQIPGVTGIIGVGGFWPTIGTHELKAHHKIPYAALTGNKDFNYSEHYVGEKQLIAKKIDNMRFIFNGPHQWAPVMDYEIALIWILSRLDPAGYNSIISNKTLEPYLKNIQDSVSAFDADRLKLYFGSTYDLTLPAPTYTSKDLRKIEKKLDNLFKSEGVISKQLSDSLNAAYRNTGGLYANTPMKWVISTADTHRKRFRREKGKNPTKADMNYRVYSRLLALTYENAINSMNINNFHQAEIAIEVWSSINKSVNYSNWMKCRFYAMQNDIPKALKHLNKLIEAGFTNGNALKSDFGFDALKNTDQYKQLVDSI